MKNTNSLPLDMTCMVPMEETFSYTKFQRKLTPYELSMKMEILTNIVEVFALPR